MNMKKSFPDEKGKKFKEFLDKRGFYIVLLLCIAVVAGTAVFVTTRRAIDRDYDAKNLSDESGDDLQAHDAALNESEKLSDKLSEDPVVLVPDEDSDIGSPASVNKDNEAKSKDSDKKNEQDTNAAPEKASPAKPAEPVKQQSFVVPVDGAVSLEYAMDKLVYSKTLEEWRAHQGIDIAADRGTPVKAVADGVVCDVKNDQFYGISVVIDHENGLKTLYRNLAADDTVIVNQKVKQGEIIGSIGNTAMDESSEQPHLHFEVLKDDVNQDPTNYLPKK
ncbi:MAG: peptidoglycan DD-metalloendopeptidase family protein [Clostridiaceae bacterium]|nr:peptidoglycan DD-metalloendopeptidase family protein [Clostridiaceae bacterium]